MHSPKNEDVQMDLKPHHPARQENKKEKIAINHICKSKA